MSQRFIDLSHTLKEGLITYKGLPAPIICDYLSRKDSEAFYEEGTSFQIGKIEMLGNSVTYIDCPFHRYEEGKDLSEVSIDRFAELPAIKVQAPYEKGLAIGPAAFEGLDLKGKAVLIQTNWSEKWGTDAYFENHPYLTEEAALYLLEQEICLAGIDGVNIDDTHGKARPVHSILLGAEILIVEHLTNLAAIPDGAFHFSAIPPKIEKMGSFPVRAFATIL